MRIMNFSSAFMSNIGFGGGPAIPGLGGLDAGLLQGGLGALDQFGGMGAVGGGLVQGLLAASGLNALQNFGRMLSGAVPGQLGGMGACCGGGGFNPFSANMLGGGSPFGQVGGLGGGLGGGFGSPMMSNSLTGGAGLQGGLNQPGGFQMPPFASGGTFEDMVAAFMGATLKQMQQEAKQLMAKLKQSNDTKGGKAGGAGGKAGGGKAGGGKAGGAEGGGDDSRQLMFEELKNMMQKIQQMFQSLSNVLNTMHQGAMNSIRNIRA